MGTLFGDFVSSLTGAGHSNGKAQPEDPEKVFLHQLTMGNRIREAMGLPDPNAQHLPQQLPVPTDGSTALWKLLLDYQLGQLRIQRDHELSERKMAFVEDVKDPLKKGLPRALKVLEHLVGEHNQEADGQGEKSGGVHIQCSECGGKWDLPQQPAPGEDIKCPHCNFVGKVPA